MLLLAPYRFPLSTEQIQRRLLWLGLDSITTNNSQALMLATDRLLYHYTSYLLVCNCLTRSELYEKLHQQESNDILSNWLKTLIRQSIEGALLKQLLLHDAQSWRIVLLHHVAHALEQTNTIENDLPFDTTAINHWQLRLIHAQPCTQLWGTPHERLLWLEEVTEELSHWPDSFTEEEHPSNGNKTLLGYIPKQPYHYLNVKEVLSELIIGLQQGRAIETPHFIHLYNKVIRLSGAYAARPLANAGLFPPEALWDTLQQHRPFVLRARHWLQDATMLPPCTRLLLNKHYTQADRPYFHWGQHDRKRYLEAMQRSLNTFLLH